MNNEQKSLQKPRLTEASPTILPRARRYTNIQDLLDYEIDLPPPSLTLQEQQIAKINRAQIEFEEKLMQWQRELKAKRLYSIKEGEPGEEEERLSIGPK